MHSNSRSIVNHYLKWTCTGCTIIRERPNINLYMAKGSLREAVKAVNTWLNGTTITMHIDPSNQQLVHHRFS
jgi:hypothetical protein